MIYDSDGKPSDFSDTHQRYKSVWSGHVAIGSASSHCIAKLGGKFYKACEALCNLFEEVWRPNMNKALTQ